MELEKIRLENELDNLLCSKPEEMKYQLEFPDNTKRWLTCKEIFELWVSTETNKNDIENELQSQKKFQKKLKKAKNTDYFKYKICMLEDRLIELKNRDKTVL